MASTAAISNDWPWPDSLDAVIAAPRHHRVVLENEYVRVLEVRIPAGETVPMHTHRWPSVLHMQQWADFIRRDEHGNQVLDTRTLPAAAKSLGPLWAGPLVPHTVENVESIEFVGIAVEIKTA